MSLQTMAADLRGAVPKLPISLAPTLINRAWREIRESGLWSFNLYEQSWITPPIVTTGTATVVQGFANITFDASAVAALLAAQTAQPYSLLTQRQFRISVGGIYNILALAPDFATSGIATLDRIWGDPGGTFGYTVYQVYYTPQFQDHLKWLSVRNPIMFLNLNLIMTRKELDAIDPQRLWYAWPTDVVSWGRDLRGAGTINASGTLNYPLYELWGQPVNPFTYQCYGLRKGVDLVQPSDTIPPSLDETMVIQLAKYYAYEWAEANKDITPRNAGPDFKFLMGKVKKDYIDLRTIARREDRELVDNWFMVRGVNAPIFSLGHYNTLAGVAGPA